MKEELWFELQQGWGDFQNLWLLRRIGEKSFNGFLKKGLLEWEEVKSMSDITDLTPFMRVTYHFPVQQMIDALTKKKPTQEQVETLSELKATKYHLEDMRKIVFKEKTE